MHFQNEVEQRLLLQVCVSVSPTTHSLSVPDPDGTGHLCQWDQLWLPRPPWETHHCSGPQRHPGYGGVCLCDSVMQCCSQDRTNWDSDIVKIRENQDWDKTMTCGVWEQMRPRLYISKRNNKREINDQINNLFLNHPATSLFSNESFLCFAIFFNHFKKQLYFIKAKKIITWLEISVQGVTLGVRVQNGSSWIVFLYYLVITV